MTTRGFHPLPAIAWQRGQSTVAFLALGVALAVGLVLAAWIVASSLERIKLAGDKITVKGYAEEKVVSDAGTWRAIVSVRAPDLATAYGKLDADSARVVRYVETVVGADAEKLQRYGKLDTDSARVVKYIGVGRGRRRGEAAAGHRQYADRL